jgi:integrase
LQQLVKQVSHALAPAAVPVASLPRFGELVDEWLTAIRPKRVAPDNEERLARRLTPLLEENEDTLTVAAIDGFLSGLSAELAPATINKLRGTGRLVVEYVQANRKWAGPNPFALVKRARVPRRRYDLLSGDELRKVQAKLNPMRRREFRVALHLGLRKGELFALQKVDVDFTTATITIRRSHGRDSTKTGKDRTIPLLPAVAGDLLEAIQASPADSLLVFPSGSAGLQDKNTKLTNTLRTAMASAGVGVTRVRYKCRRTTCDAEDLVEVGHTVDRDRDCPQCGMRLWPVPTVRAVRWYDLRHMAATFHREAGADPLAIALLLGHAVHQTTEAVYTHLSSSTLMRELSKWKL